MNKLEELIHSMTGYEIKAFRVSGIQKSVLNTFDSALDSIQSRGNLDKAWVYRKCTGKKSYQDKAWRYLQTEITDALENFFLQKYLSEQSALTASLKYKSLIARNCTKAAAYFYDHIKHIPEANADHFLLQFNTREAELKFLSTQSRKKEPDYQAMLHLLDVYYIAKKLQLSCEVANYGNVLTIDAPVLFIEEIKNIAAEKSYSSVGIISIYQLILRTLTEPADENNFSKLNKIITQYAAELPADELKEIYTYVKNYCVRQINTGNTDYVRTLFDIYIDYIRNDRLMKSEYLSEFEFKNIVSLALRLKETEWCRNFIKKYISYLPPADRKNAMNYNQAYFYFQTRDFKAAIRKLQDVEFKDFVYQLDSRVILLKSYFELDEDDSFFYHASAFRLFLLRNRHLSEYQKTINRNLIRFLTAIRRNAGNKIRMQEIKKQILKEKNVADLKWLLEKINE